MENTVALIAAAGMGSRMQAGVNKQFLKIGGKTVLAHTLAAFENATCVHGIIVICHPNEIEAVKALVHENGFGKVLSTVPGGADRQASIAQGLGAVPEDTDWVLVHDGARPFIQSKQIDEMTNRLTGFSEQQESSPSMGSGGNEPPARGLIMAVPVKDTIKQVAGQKVVKTLSRASLWQVQTPQGFACKDLMAAYALAKSDGFKGTDDASLFEHMGGVVEVVQGSYENIKVTTPEDMYIGEAILKKRGVRLCELE